MDDQEMMKTMALEKIIDFQALYGTNDIIGYVKDLNTKIKELKEKNQDLHDEISFMIQTSND
jgi:hypothetical protein